MRLRLPVITSAGAALAFAVVPAIATAAPHSDRSITIHATPSHIIAGEPVLIFGRLEGPHHADRLVTLWHKVAPKSQFSIVSHTRTNLAGQYAFPHAQDIVESNRNWFVRGPGFTHSTTIHEAVAAEVTLVPSATEGVTRTPLTFTGQVTPGHAGDHVALQVQNGDGNVWHTVANGRVGAHSTYSFKYAWRSAGARSVRVFFDGDVRNTPSTSDPSAVVINQRQAPHFSIASSAPLLADGATATISGVLDLPHSATADPDAAVGLYARTPGGGAFALVQNGTTGTAGDYSFNVLGLTNELYQVRTLATPFRHSSIVFQGVQDTVSFTSSAPTSTVGGQVTLAGSVAPDKTGHVAYLESLGRDGQWQIAGTTMVTPASTFSFLWTFGASGTKMFRVRVLGGPLNLGGVSAPVTVTVSEPALSALPTS